MSDKIDQDGSWDAARALVLRFGWNATAYQLLNPGMRRWFSRAVRAWLATRGLPGLQFMVGTDSLQSGDDRRVFVATQGSHSIVGFLVATPVPTRSGWLVEEWPRVPTAPNGTTHLLVDAAMRAFAELGSSYATLGLAPLSSRGAGNDVPPPLWLRTVLLWVKAHGRRFYNFSGLEAFKASLQPAEWEPVFAVVQGRHFSPWMLRAIAGVFSGGMPELFVARALLAATRHEAGRLRGVTRTRDRHWQNKGRLRR